jgi:hypothetical protein
MINTYHTEILSESEDERRHNTEHVSCILDKYVQDSKWIGERMCDAENESDCLSNEKVINIFCKSERMPNGRLKTANNFLYII